MYFLRESVAQAAPNLAQIRPPPAQFGWTTPRTLHYTGYVRVALLRNSMDCRLRGKELAVGETPDTPPCSVAQAVRHVVKGNHCSQQEIQHK